MNTLSLKTIAACLLFVMGACCVSCYHAPSADDEEVDQIAKKLITFNDFTVTKMDIKELDMGESRAATGTSETSVNHLLVVDVFEGDIAQTVERHDSDGHSVLAEPVEMLLTAGKHDIYFISSENRWHAFDREKLSLQWNDQTGILKDVWAKHLALKVDANTEETKAIKMDRCVAYVQVKINDALPQHLSSFRMDMTGGSWEYSLTKRGGQAPVQIGRTVSVPSSYIGNTGVGIGLFSFVPDGASSAPLLEVVARDATGAAITSHSFYDVPLTVNRYASYSGNFFTGSRTNTLSVEEDWAAPYELNY